MPLLSNLFSSNAPKVDTQNSPRTDSEPSYGRKTQSGETVDTLAGMEEGRIKGSHLAAIVNVIGSQAARVSDSVHGPIFSETSGVPPVSSALSRHTSTATATREGWPFTGA